MDGSQLLMTREVLFGVWLSTILPKARWSGGEHKLYEDTVTRTLQGLGPLGLTVFEKDNNRGAERPSMCFLTH